MAAAVERLNLFAFGANPDKQTQISDTKLNPK